MIDTSLLYLKMHQPHNRALIQRLQQLVSVEQPTFKDFQETGLMMSRQDFEKSANPTGDATLDLRINCTDVVWYAMTGQIIEGLDSGYFVGEANGYTKRSKTLDVVEQFIFENGR